MYFLKYSFWLTLKKKKIFFDIFVQINANDLKIKQLTAELTLYCLTYVSIFYSIDIILLNLRHNE